MSTSASELITMASFRAALLAATTRTGKPLLNIYEGLAKEHGVDLTGLMTSVGRFMNDRPLSDGKVRHSSAISMLRSDLSFAIRDKNPEIQPVIP